LLYESWPVYLRHRKHAHSTGSPSCASADVEIAANQPVELKIDKTKNGQRIIQRDTILLAPGARYDQQITY
jgi:hypothetical protein